MMGRTHLAIGLLVALLLLPLVQDKVLFILLVLFGSLLPDIDHEGSMINRRLPITRWVPLFFKHRGFFHSLFPPIIIAGAALFMGFPQVGLFISIGYLSHLFSDALTESGVNLIYPINRFQIRGFFRTNGVMEFFLLVVVLALDVLVGVRSLGIL